MKPKHHLLSSGVLLIIIIIFGFINRITLRPDKAAIIWSERPLVWDDFQMVRYIDDNFDASVYTNISCPKLITESNSKVYAFMNPNESERLRKSHLHDDLLVHEQYHFNITEYCARLLRRDIVNKGLGGLSYGTMKSLHRKYLKKCDSLQNVYDSITDHSTEVEKQRKWELMIDDLLRQTAYYKDEDIYTYYNFTNNRTSYFRHIFYTFDQDILTSYPVDQNDIKQGETYEVIWGAKEKTIKFYKDGLLSDGGYFNTAITKIRKEKDLIEEHYYDGKGTYNLNLEACIEKVVIRENKNRLIQYFDSSGKRVEKNGVYEKKWQFIEKDTAYLASYYDRKGKQIKNRDGVYYEKRVLDEKDRPIRIENLDRRKRPVLDKEFISKYEYVFNRDNKLESYKLFDKSGSLAYHLADYNIVREYDERGNISRIRSINDKGTGEYDNNGVSIYEYTYDLNDRITSEKRFNDDFTPVIGNDDFFEQIRSYDSQGRLLYEGYYYPEQVLKFSDYKWGATKYEYEGDSIVREYNLDAFGNVIENENKIALIKKRLNARNEIIREEYLDADGCYAKTEDHVVGHTFRYDSIGNKLETTALDSLSRPVAFEEDVAQIRWEYDKAGNKIKTSYYTITGHLASGSQGVTFNLYQYNNKNELTEITYLDIEGRPATFDGAFKTRIYPNRFGKDSVRLDYDTDGSLKQGVCITRSFYNDYGNEMLKGYYNAYNQRIKDNTGVSAIKYRYNERQQLNGYEYLNDFNALTNNMSGVAIEKWKLNNKGHRVFYEYFDKNKSPVPGPEGYHRIEFSWGKVAEVTKTKTFGPDNELIEDENGIATYKYILAPSGLTKIVERYDSHGALALDPDGIAITYYEENLNGLYYLEKELNAAREVVNDTLTASEEMDL